MTHTDQNNTHQTDTYEPNEIDPMPEPYVEEVKPTEPTITSPKDGSLMGSLFKGGLVLAVVIPLTLLAVAPDLIPQGFKDGFNVQKDNLMGMINGEAEVEANTTSDEVQVEISEGAEIETD